jgi:hypothetical protein
LVKKLETEREQNSAETKIDTKNLRASYQKKLNELSLEIYKLNTANAAFAE